MLNYVFIVLIFPESLLLIRLTVILFLHLIVDERVTKRTYNFAQKSNLPLHFVSAASGVNVVKIFKEAIRLGVEHKKHPPDSYFNDLMDVLNNVRDYVMT